MPISCCPDRNAKAMKSPIRLDVVVHIPGGGTVLRFSLPARSTASRLGLP